MDYQVLTRDKMQHLEALGVDTSKASCMWTAVTDKDYNPTSWLVAWRGPEPTTIEKMRRAFPLTCKEGNLYYAFTAEDIIEYICNMGYVLEFGYLKEGYWIDVFAPYPNVADCPTLLEAAYMMLQNIMSNVNKNNNNNSAISSN